ncbi:hypothetical protein H8B02_32745 [Bradyrhizobium sp. Pear77]|uniref:hypothetical protein n=1 Tax=Bradyrhizobium TaxID=374 RepID=UPI001E62C197|nr:MULTISPECIES: hypothetical protein [Bradyrhizobium]MCC8958026.1 hypothetical protein [Bradyrhizobium altum]MCC8967115.1 hypothetical protein [Bradyrhizobium oropedii]
MALHFRRVDTGDLEIWIASSDDYSFVISNESRNGPRLHGEPGFVASYRPDFLNKPAAQVAGSPFGTFAEAEQACNAFLRRLIIEG